MTTPPQETTLPNPAPTEPDDTQEFEAISEADEPEALNPDEPPHGAWVDTDVVIGGLTEHEAEEGRRLGEQIDTGNDDDAGGDV